jgi:L-arabinose isomerase
MLLVSEGQSVSGPILEIGNTNSHWPAHHCAPLGIWHIALKLDKLASLLGIEIVKVCRIEEI